MRAAYIAALVQAVIIGFSYMFVKFGLASADTWLFLAWRFTFALAAGCALLLSRRFTLRITLADLPPLLPLAVLYPALFFILQTLGMHRVSSSEAGIIGSTAPIFTLVFARLLLNENAAAIQIACAALSMAGVAFISIMNGQQGAESDLLGVCLILGTALSQALYNVLARKRLRRIPVFDLAFAMIAFSFVVFWTIALAQRGGGGLTAPFLDSWRFTASVSYLGVLSSFGTALLANFILTRLSAFTLSVSYQLSIVVAMTAGMLALHETLAWYHYLGALAIITGVLGTAYFKSPAT